MNRCASHSVTKNPPQSVNVVAKIVADWAGSKPSVFMMNGMRDAGDDGVDVVDDQGEADDHAQSARAGPCRSVVVVEHDAIDGR